MTRKRKGEGKYLIALQEFLYLVLAAFFLLLLLESFENPGALSGLVLPFIVIWALITVPGYRTLKVLKRRKDRLEKVAPFLELMEQADHKKYQIARIFFPSSLLLLLLSWSAAWYLPLLNLLSLFLCYVIVTCFPFFLREMLYWSRRVSEKEMAHGSLTISFPWSMASGSPIVFLVAFLMDRQSVSPRLIENIALFLTYFLALAPVLKFYWDKNERPYELMVREGKIEELIKALKQEPPARRGAIIEALGLAAEQDHAETLLRHGAVKQLINHLVWEIDGNKVARALRSLGNGGERDHVVRCLCRALGSALPYVRYHVVWTLGEIGDNTVIRELEKLCEDQDVVSLWIAAEKRSVDSTVGEAAKEAVRKLSGNKEKDTEPNERSEPTNPDVKSTA